MGEERTREDADAGVAECMRRMSEGRWLPGKSHAEVARNFNVSPATVKNWATNASRVLRLIVAEDVEEVRTSMLTTLSRVVDVALTKQAAAVSKTGEVHYYDAPDLRAAVAAIEAQAKLLGLVVQKHDVRTRPAVTHLSRDEHRAELERLQGEIAAEVARLASEGE